MKKSFNSSWQFVKTDIEADYRKAVGFFCGGCANGSENERGRVINVELPHDWLINNGGDYYETSQGWYRKLFKRPSGKNVFLYFEGVYMDCEIYINSEKAGEWKYGYTSFFIDISRFLNDSENEIIVRVRHENPNSRWYSGAGIYRNVYLIDKADDHIVPDGIYYRSKRDANGDFDVCVTADVFGNGEIEAYIEDGLGNEICISESSTPCEAAARYSEIYKKAVEKYSFTGLSGIEETDISGSFRGIYCRELSGHMPAPKLWSAKDPVLYTLTVILKKDGVEIDRESMRVGFRTFDINHEGLFVNGEKIKLHGVCEHHDLGALGAAFEKSAMKRKIRILKDMGVNAVRTAHNPPAPGMLELCDEMGTYVIDELYDMWELSINKYDNARFFGEHSAQDVQSWVRRDRNHPCVLMWSLGNEIPDTINGDRGEEIAKHLAVNVYLHDPFCNARATIGSNFLLWDKAIRCTDVTKVAGYNYLEKLYEDHHERFPDWAIYGSETASMVTSRGIYHFPLSESIMSDEDGQCSSIGNSTSSWGAKNVESCIYIDRDTPYSMGQFLWSGFDYIGEPTPYRTKNSYFGQTDTAGFPKDQYYVFRAEWAGMSVPPFVHLYPYWDFNEGQMIDVRATTNCAAVELYVNGKSLGTDRIDHARGKELVATRRVPYEKGCIEAYAYDENGNVLAKAKRVSFSDTKNLTVSMEEHDENGLYFFDIGAVDRDGNPVENASDYVNVSVKNGKLIGLDNGDSTDYDAYASDTRKLFSGKLLAIVKADDEKAPTIEAEKAKGPDGNVPVRKIALSFENGSVLTPDMKEGLKISAELFPNDATDGNIEWKVVNTAGIEVSTLYVSDVSDNVATIHARGDGNCYVRAVSKSGTDSVRLISQLEISAQGFGAANTNPYRFVSAGLFDRTFGKVGSGNDKGICFEENARSGAVYERVDFGSFGSDEITVWLFTFSDASYKFLLYTGDAEEPDKCDGPFVLEYRKTCDWNVYKPQTFKLPKRIKGICTLTFASDVMYHFKGFEFTKTEKAYSVLYPAEADILFGDSYKVCERAVTDIGNNVNVSFTEMDFGEKGASKLLIHGKTPLSSMSVRLAYTEKGKDTIVFDFKVGKGSDRFETDIPRLTGCGRVDLIFLPGSNFDFYDLAFT